jgi:hypothetical protein
MNKVSVPKTLVGFNYLVTRFWLIYIVLFVFFSVSILISLCNKDFTWLSAFGGVMTIFGVLLTVSHSVPKTDDDIKRFIELRFPESRDGIFPELVTEEQQSEIDNSREREATRVLKSEAIGLLITIIGTLIWAYVGFLNSIFLSNL